jgi:hypothetical protein
MIGALVAGLSVFALVGIGLYAWTTSKRATDVLGMAGEKAAAVTAADVPPPSTNAPSTGREASATQGWDGRSTFECKGDQSVTLTGVTANVDGTAIRASGHCRLSLIGVDIVAPVGIEASGNARVTLTGGSIRASASAVIATSLARVHCVGTKVTGAARASGTASISCID